MASPSRIGSLPLARLSRNALYRPRRHASLQQAKSDGAAADCRSPSTAQSALRQHSLKHSLCFKIQSNHPSFAAPVYKERRATFRLNENLAMAPNSRRHSSQENAGSAVTLCHERSKRAYGKVDASADLGTVSRAHT
jgi:hypothetical protein